MSQLADLEFRYESMLDEYPDTVIVFGNAKPDALGCLLLEKRMDSALVFAGGSRSGSVNQAVPAVLNQLCKDRIEAPLHPGIPPEPTVEDVRGMVKVLNEEKAENIIAVGGGSVMDAAKAAYLSYQTGLDVSELFGVNRASEKFPGKTFKKVLCVPTTAGTGSEVTPYANIVDNEAGVKKLVMDNAVIPSHAFVDPLFTLTMPRELSAHTALDALVHCVESVLNVRAQNAHPNSVQWGLTGIRLIAAGLPAVLADGHHELGRTFLSAAATLGGMCIRNRPTSLPHLCSFSFYGKTSHGAAVAALLPPFWRYYLEEPAVREITMKMAGVFAKQAEKRPEEVVEHAAEFIAKNGGPAHLSDLGCPKEIIAKVAGDALLNPMKLQSSPRAIDPARAGEIITEILNKAW